ncbi:thymidylate synthase family protein [Xanthobacter sediminis]|uniref:thymidylate synthase n=1 Tax=Xanthobacter sediminis TaxID=3119926 RepID=UPI003729BC25
MSRTEPETIVAANLSLGWAAVLDRLAHPGVEAISPLSLSITGFDDQGAPAEVQAIRAGVDALLKAKGKRDIENVAWTIFPERYWRMAGGDRVAFFEMFREAFSRIQDYNPQNNKRGSYFQRMVDFEGGGKSFNQLAWILDEYNRNPNGRRSKWQATTFDPYRDMLTTAQLEFPCLQQVSFTFLGNEGLILNAFYATQQIVHKGYGNYLGLARLGAFMASQMGRRLERLNIFVGIAKMDKIGKSDPDFAALLTTVRAELTASKNLQSVA